MGSGYACVGAPDDAPVVAYPWPTTFVEAQARWMPTRAGQTGNDFEHAHVGSSIPERETITAATIPIDIRVTLHDNPGKLIYVGVVVKGTSYENTVAKLYDPTLVGQRDGTVNRWLHYDLPLSAFHSSGLQEIPYRLFVSEPNTTDITHASLNFQTNIANGAPVANVTRLPFLRLKGWYVDRGTANPGIGRT